MLHNNEFKLNLTSVKRPVYGLYPQSSSISSSVSSKNCIIESTDINNDENSYLNESGIEKPVVFLASPKKASGSSFGSSFRSRPTTTTSSTAGIDKCDPHIQAVPDYLKTIVDSIESLSMKLDSVREMVKSVIDETLSERFSNEVMAKEVVNILIPAIDALIKSHVTNTLNYSNSTQLNNNVAISTVTKPPILPNSSSYLCTNACFNSPQRFSSYSKLGLSNLGGNSTTLMDSLAYSDLNNSTDFCNASSFLNTPFHTTPLGPSVRNSVYHTNGSSGGTTIKCTAVKKTYEVIDTVIDQPSIQHSFNTSSYLEHHTQPKDESLKDSGSHHSDSEPILVLDTDTKPNTPRHRLLNDVS